MLRTLVEIASFGKIERVTKNKLFYRSLGDPALKNIYADNFIQIYAGVQVGSNPMARSFRAKIHTGFLRKREGVYIIEECGYGRIDRNQIRPLPGQPLYVGGKPNWRYQNRIIYIQIGTEQDHFFPRQVNRRGKERHPDLYLRYRAVNSVSFSESPGLRSATLVMTGDMQHKHLEFVFLHETLREYEVSNEILQRFHDDDQITKWQEDTFPKDMPNPGCRSEKGYLRDGEPIFFILEEDQETVRFIGRAQMFRLPYNFSPFDFIPEVLRDISIIDLPEAIFGFVRDKKQEEDQQQTRAGRVFISDAICKEADTGNIWFTNGTVTPKILASPKPTTFQHYLVQTNDKQRDVKHYASSPNEETLIRGHKLYWHKGSSPAIMLENPNEVSESQTTQIKPINKGVHFTFTIYFENLSGVELGALLWVLHIAQSEKYRLSLGLGKPLGMGAVKIAHDLHLSDRQERYTNLFNDDQWATGECPASAKEGNYIDAFERYVLEKIGETGKLNDVRRIKMLLAMLSWHESPSPDQTRYMEIERDINQPHIGQPRHNDRTVNEYKDRPILPTPLQVIGWESDSGSGGQQSRPNTPNNPHRGSLSPRRGTGEINNAAFTRPKPQGRK